MQDNSYSMRDIFNYISKQMIDKEEFYYKINRGISSFVKNEYDVEILLKNESVICTKCF
jgi:hypothetical protein